MTQIEAGGPELIGRDLVDDDVGLLFDVFQKVAQRRGIERRAGFLDQALDDFGLLFIGRAGPVSHRVCVFLGIGVDRIEKVIGEVAQALTARDRHDPRPVFIVELMVERGQTPGKR